MITYHYISLVKQSHHCFVHVMLPYFWPGGQTGTSELLGVGPLVKAFNTESLSLSLNVLYSTSLYC